MNHPLLMGLGIIVLFGLVALLLGGWSALLLYSLFALGFAGAMVLVVMFLEWWTRS